MHPTGPMLAFQLSENFSEALASPAYMVATPMLSAVLLQINLISMTTVTK